MLILLLVHPLLLIEIVMVVVLHHELKLIGVTDLNILLPWTVLERGAPGAHFLSCHIPIRLPKSH